MIAYRAARIIQLGIKSLLLHKLRSGLTMLGIIFGVCSVISMLAIGEGASYEAQEAIKRLGSNNVIIRSVKPSESSEGASQTRSFVNEYGLKYDDATRLQATIPGVKAVLPKRIIREKAAFDQQVEVPCQVIGTYAYLPGIMNVEVIRGRFLTEIDELHQNNICAITTSLAQRLFPYQDPMKHAIRVGGFYYQIVGIVREKDAVDQRSQSGDLDGQPVDSNIYIPLSTSRSRFGETIFSRGAGSFQAERVELHEITVQMDSTDFVETADPQIKTLLKHFHDKIDYEVIVPLQLLREAEQTKRIFNIVLGSIAAISLIVGGIGIMNIMLASVTERTREIGVRRALGAKKRDITLQFLVETVVLSVGGGLIGVIVGIIVPLLVSHFADMKTIITPFAVLIAFSISGFVGVVFGIYPANAAADLDPIEALRHE